jgi:hypothetical protein
LELPHTRTEPYLLWKKGKLFPGKGNATSHSQQVLMYNSIIDNPELAGPFSNFGLMAMELLGQSFFHKEDAWECYRGSTVLPSFAAYMIKDESKNVMKFWTRSDVQRAGYMYYFAEPYHLQTIAENFFMRAKERFMRTGAKGSLVMRM